MSKTALITGASKRIGRAIAEHLAFKGWSVIIHYNHSGKEAENLKEELEAQFPNQKFETIKANLANIDEVLGLVKNAVLTAGQIDLLVNNASVFDPSYLKETEVDLYNLQFDVNIKAPFFLIRDFANQCKKGNVINFVDTRVTSNKSNFAAYSLSKKSLWDLTKMSALELSPEIRVNAVAPGVTLPPEDEDENYLDKLAQNIPMKKPGGIVPILQSVDYILENNHLTGQLLFADGGENLGENV